MSVISYQAQRTFPEHKTVNYMCGVPPLAEAKRQGAHEALYCDEQGFVSEGVTSNIHALMGNTVRSCRLIAFRALPAWACARSSPPMD